MQAFLPTAPDFIFMLTHSDRTILDAPDRLIEALDAGVRHIGFKDIGLPLADLRRLAASIRAADATLYLEMVSLDAASEEASARAAVELGIDVLMGGVHPHAVVPVLANTGIRYYPFSGEIVGHPNVLQGTIDTIVESACRLAAMDAVHGLNLLAYRFQGDVPALIRRVCSTVAPKPVIVAGSIDRPDRIAAVIDAGAAGFTVGTAALNGDFPARSRRLADQLMFVAEQALAR
ncbi:4-hydroxythreonine-4-phosphate dehydrogenase [Microvirga massiliensis]|uniref:4-hydroxythreonine-4-phosphate dehydrogenase n=1 Tax=Microvirga massiliensis TaxID=1033741 RepID=UPI00062B94C3|nr:4-hydroxythreonine-4-phosphate dehydrogenase [Microvirga massiliensis]